MAQFDPLWLEHQRRRWMPPRAQQWIRPQTQVWTRPSSRLFLSPLPKERKHDAERTSASDTSMSDVEEAREQHLELKRLLAEIRLDLLRLEYLRKYRDDQPRDQLGRWTVDGGQATTDGSDAGRNDSRVLSDATPDNAWKPGAQYAQNETPPPLRRIHPDTTYERDRRAKQSLEFWSQQRTDRIVDSLKPGNKDSLKVYPDGGIADGNTRVKVLQERGYDVHSLPRELHRPVPSGPSGPRGGGGGFLRLWPWQ